ncbi:MAG: exosortase C-terminal domain/associated protein EpsI [Myxococcota bacterium]
MAEIVAGEDRAGRSGVIKTLVAVAFIVANFYTYHFLASTPKYPDRQQFSEFPLHLDEWSCPGLVSMDEQTRINLGVTDYMICRFANAAYPYTIDVYVGYHASQVREEGGGAGENSIHPPAHCLPGSGWDIIANSTVRIDIPGLPDPQGTAKRMIIAKGKARRLVYYWYQSRGRVISEDWKKIVYVGLDRALRQRTDGSLIRFTIPIERNDEQTSERAFRDLAPRVLALLPAYVPD